MPGILWSPTGPPNSTIAAFLRLDPEMTWTYGKKPKLIAAAARNADGTWAVGLANFTHASFTDRRDDDDQHGLAR